MNPERLRLERAVPAHPRFANRHVGNLPPMPDYPALVVRDAEMAAGWRCGSGERKPAWPGPLVSARKQSVMRLKRNLQLVGLRDDATRRSMQHLCDALCRVIAMSHSLEIVDVQVRPTASHDASI
jgi:hypothetical protein